MTPQERSRGEYIAKINRVMDYVEQHLCEPLGLDIVSGVAHLSPFHFHRIFSLIVGETPADFIMRLKLEKAAQQIKDYSDLSISEIAYNCGFGSISQFSRSFRRQFGITASDYRFTDKPLLVNGGRYYSKNGQLVHKNGQRSEALEAQLCSVKLNQIIMDTTIEVKQMPAFNVIYCRHTGAFDQIGNAYSKLMRWAGPRGLIGPGAQTMTVYHDDPSVTSIDKVRQSACLVVQNDVKVEGEIGKMSIPAGKYAVGRFEIDASEFEKAWNTVCLWFTESGYEPGQGLPYELYWNNHEEHPQHKFILDICIPVMAL